MTYSRQGLDWIFGPEYSFRVFSTSRFAPVELSLVEVIILRDTYFSSFTGEDKTLQTNRHAVIIFSDTHFSSLTEGSNWAFRYLDCGINNWKTDSKSKVYRPQFWRKNVIFFTLEWVQIKRGSFQCLGPQALKLTQIRISFIESGFLSLKELN